METPDESATVTVSRDEFAARAARNVIERLRPDEMPQFDSAARAFRAASWQQRRRAARRNEALGMGVDGTVVMLTVPALFMLTKIAEKMAEYYAQKTADTLTKRMGRWMRRLLRRPEPVPVQWAPTRAEVDRIRAIGARQARALKLDEAVSKSLIDAIVVELTYGGESDGRD